MKFKTVSPVWMFIIAIGAFIVSAIFLNNFTTNKGFNPEEQKFVLWFFRVVTALSASAISISIPGMIKVSYNQDGTFIKTQTNEVATLADKQPSIVAGGAIAVFVLVYLFNPINGM